MEANQQNYWTEFLEFFTKHNVGRCTRLGVFRGSPSSVDDYWIEDGLPLAGVDMDPDGEKGPCLQIMLQKGNDLQHMTHAVNGVRSLTTIISTGSNNDGLDIQTRSGETTVLRFEN